MLMLTGWRHAERLCARVLDAEAVAADAAEVQGRQPREAAERRRELCCRLQCNRQRRRGISTGARGWLGECERDRMQRRLAQCARKKAHWQAARQPTTELDEDSKAPPSKEQSTKLTNPRATKLNHTPEGRCGPLAVCGASAAPSRCKRRRGLCCATH